MEILLGRDYGHTLRLCGRGFLYGAANGKNQMGHKGFDAHRQEKPSRHPRYR